MTTQRAALLRFSTALLIGATALLPLAGHTRAAGATENDGPNLIVNGGFERGIDPGRTFVFPTGDTSALLQGWTLLNAGLDKFLPGVTYVGTMLPAEEGKKCVEIANGGENKQNIGGIKQSFSTIPGRQYRLSFYQSADIFQTGPRIMKLTVAGQTRQYTYMPNPDEWQNVQKMRWIARTFVFTATDKTSTLEFDSVLSTNAGGNLIDNVQVRQILPTAGSGNPAGGPAGGPVASTTSLKLSTPTIPAGGQQTLQVTAGANAPLVVVIDYPGGTQAAVQAHAGADGHYTYSWSVPASVSGTVRVLVDGAGSVAQATFAVS